MTDPYGTPTTRRYARTLAQAFPQDHAEAIEHVYSRSVAERASWAVLATLLGIFAALAILHLAAAT